MSDKHPLSVGRPRWEPDVYVMRRIREAGTIGLNQKQTARFCGLGLTTWYEKIAVFPQMIQEYELGKLEGIHKVSQGLLVNALTPTPSAPGGNVGAQLAYLREVADWGERERAARAAASAMESTNLDDALRVTIVLPDNGRVPVDDADTRARTTTRTAD